MFDAVPSITDSSANRPPAALFFGPFRLFPLERRLERDGADLPLGSRALDILIALTAKAGQIVSRRELVAEVWPDLVVEESSLRVHVAGLRKALGDGRNGARYISNVPGRGYCFVAPVDRGNGDHNGRGTQAAGPTRMHSLPPRPSRLVGRGRTISDIGSALLQARFLSIVGPGGIGKTTAAVSAAYQLAEEFEQICFLDLGSLADPALIVGTLASALRLSIHAKDPMSSLMDHLQTSRSLLVFDNCEHLIDAVAPLVEEIYVRTPHVHMLTTTREALRVQGEQVFHLPPLEAPPPDANLTPDEIRTFPAVALFLDRAATAGYRRTITDGELSLVAEICGRLDGLALAIELVAGRAGIHGIEGTAGLLDNRFRLLWQGRRTAPARHQTLNALVDWSYNLLPEHERQVLRLLSIFVGAFTLDAARTLVINLNLEGEPFEELIEGLASKSLISVEKTQGHSVRYRLLETTRAHALNKLVDSEEMDAAAKLHASYFAGLFEANLRIPALFRRLNSSGAFAGFLGNVRAALDWCFDGDRAVEIGAELIAMSASHLLDLSLISECYSWAKRALVLLGSRPTHTLEIELQEALALSAMFMTESTAEVYGALRRGLELAEAHEDRPRQVRILAGLNLFLTRIGECREALAVAEESKRLASQISDPDANMVSDWMLGITHSLLGNLSLARIHLDNGFAHGAARTLDLNFIGYAQRIRARVYLARTHWLHGFPDQALRLAREALAEAGQNGHPVNICICLAQITPIFLWCGDWDSAEEIVEKLTSHADRHRLMSFHGVGLGFRGELLVRKGKPSLGNPLLRDGLAAMEAEKHKAMSAGFAVALAGGLAATSQYEEALAIIAKAIDDASLSGEEFELPEMFRVKAQVLCAAHGREASEVDDCLNCSLDYARRQSALGWELRSAVTLAQRRRQECRISEAYDVLAPVYGRFVEGHGTRDLKLARGLISDLRRHSARRRSSVPTWRTAAEQH